MILDPVVEEYIKNGEEFFPKLRVYADDNHIPILRLESLNFILTQLLLKSPKNILEIGTAIGYSALCFKKVLIHTNITTIEIDEIMAEIARENFKEYKANINLLEGDAIDILPKIKEKYEALFIDARKSQYKNFLNLSKPLLKERALIITDNILLGGMVADFDSTPRKKRAMVKHMMRYNDFLLNDKDFLTSLIPIGDGIAVSIYRPFSEEIEEV